MPTRWWQKGSLGSGLRPYWGQGCHFRGHLTRLQKLLPLAPTSKTGPPWNSFLVQIPRWQKERKGGPVEIAQLSVIPEKKGWGQQ